MYVRRCTARIRLPCNCIQGHSVSMGAGWLKREQRIQMSFSPSICNLWVCVWVHTIQGWSMNHFWPWCHTEDSNQSHDYSSRELLPWFLTALKVFWWKFTNQRAWHIRRFGSYVCTVTATVISGWVLQSKRQRKVWCFQNHWCVTSMRKFSLMQPSRTGFF